MKYVKNALAFFGLLVLIGLCVQAVVKTPATGNADKSTSANANPKAKGDSLPEKVVQDYNVYALPLPEDIKFAGESVPLQDPDVRRRLDRELLVNTYWQSNGLLLLKRAHAYFPIIEPILDKYGVPDDFKYLAVIESGLQPVVSPAGARGFWQFTKDTGRRYGLEINANIDERYNIEKATRAAAQFLNDAKDSFGSWTLAAAAYNAGRTGIKRQLKRQDADNYYNLFLTTETNRYIFRILALKEIMKHPQKYGFNFKTDDLYHTIPTHEVEVDTPITNLADFAKSHGINYKILKLHNRWLRQDHLNDQSRKLYHIKIPREGYYPFKPK